MRSSERLLTFIVLLIATLWLAGCQTAPTAHRELPPAVLLEDCVEPEALIETNQALAEYALALRAALRVCNNDKAALRDWASQE